MSSNQSYHRLRKGLRLSAAAAVVALVVAGCSSSKKTTSPSASTSGPTASASASVPVAASSGGGSSVPAPSASSPSNLKADITFWTWVAGLEPNVAAFNKVYPDVHVTIVNAGQSAAEYAKLRTALKAGQGVPDVAQIEYQLIPTFAKTNDLLDLTPYTSSIKDLYPAGVWAQITQNGKPYGVPQDTGPMAMMYRDDIFKKYNITPPTTWAEFAADGKKIHAADPNVYMSTFAPNDPGWLSAMLWQAGQRAFNIKSASEIGININDAGAKKFAATFGPMIKDGTVSTDPDFADSWYKGLAAGKYATWITAGWGPYFMQGNVKASSGQWRVAPIPQYAAGEHLSAAWGGSSDAVLTKSAHPEAAAAFATFINSDPASANMLVTNQHFFPAVNAVLQDPAFTDQTPEYFGGQKIYQVFSDAAKNVDPSFTFSPFQDVVNQDGQDIVGKAMADKSDLGAAFDSWNKAVTDYATKQGFKVSS
jgi:multiple sugar transport system substrate-binding protein